MIRELSRDDIPAVVNIVRTHWWGDAIAHKAARQMLEMFEGGSSLGRPYYFVEEEDNRVVGFAGFMPAWLMANAFQLIWIAVAPSHQGRGIGQRLTERRLEEIKRRGGRLVMLTTKKEGFFEQFGFRALADFGGHKLMVLEIH